MKYYLSIGAIFKNEAPYLGEWITFHYLNGVERFYLYNNNSTDNYLEELKPYMDLGIIELIDWPYELGQISAYNDIIKKNRNLSKWVAFIDIDEFLFCNGKSIPDFLQDFEDCSGVCVHWLLFGSNGHIEEPSGNVLDNYLMRSADNCVTNKHVKSIIQPLQTVSALDPHRCNHGDFNAPVDENRNPVLEAVWDDITFNKIRINHYFCKSKMSFEKKMQRGRADIVSPRNWKSFSYHDKNEVYDKYASDLFNLLKNNQRDIFITKKTCHNKKRIIK